MRQSRFRPHSSQRSPSEPPSPRRRGVEASSGPMALDPLDPGLHLVLEGAVFQL